jgi:hypothetical protein
VVRKVRRMDDGRGGNGKGGVRRKERDMRGGGKSEDLGEG